jgi:hypothetical protein
MKWTAYCTLGDPLRQFKHCNESSVSLVRNILAVKFEVTKGHGVKTDAFWYTTTSGLIYL